MSKIFNIAISKNIRKTLNPTNTALAEQYLNIGLATSASHMPEQSRFGLHYHSDNDSVEDMTWVIGGDPKTEIRFGGDIKSFKGGEGAGSSYISSPPLLSFSQRKSYHTTDTNSGQIIEYWSNKGYQITMKGLFTDMLNHDFPFKAVSEMRDVFQTDSVVRITKSKIFDAYGIKNMYITQWSTSAVEGLLDTVSYTLSAISIKENTFELKA